MQEFLYQLWQQTGLSVLLITHDIDEALLLAQQIHVLAPRPGRIIRSLTVDFDHGDMMALRLSTPFLERRQELANCLRQLDGTLN
jgi:NitT/TauT family transport system ATP-binding protein